MNLILFTVKSNEPLSEDWLKIIICRKFNFRRKIYFCSLMRIIKCQF
jgi:hypothetical protein